MWRILGCTAKGKSHELNGTECQDKICKLEKNGATVIALADGAGSAKLSHFGAEMVTSFICEKLCSNFEEIFNNEDGAAVKKEVLDEIGEQIAILAKEKQCDQYDLSSTLLVAAVKDNNFILIHLGDGVVGLHDGEKLIVASKPTNGEYANTTVFTTSKNALTSIKMIKGNLNDKKGFVLMSDGTSESLYNKSQNMLSDGIRTFMEKCEKCNSHALNEQLIESFNTDIRSKTSDDCSIAILYNDSNSFQGYEKLPTIERIKIVKTDSYNRLFKDSDKIIKLVAKGNGKTMKQIQTWIHKKPSRVKETTKGLERLDIIYQKDGVFRPIIKTIGENNGKI